MTLMVGRRDTHVETEEAQMMDCHRDTRQTNILHLKREKEKKKTDGNEHQPAHSSRRVNILDTHTHTHTDVHTGSGT